MNNQTINWLLESDNPSVRYSTLRSLYDPVPSEGTGSWETKMQAARRTIMDSEPAQKILAAQDPEGY